ncbi:MAG: class I SAM-dependent methyltransferase [Acidobacteriota bacterium]|nr:class I SAM-dependent methyltransferase [Acidobacteriota bacterium]
MNEENTDTAGKSDNDIPAEDYQNNSRKFIPGYDGLYSLAEILLAENLPDKPEILIVGAGGGKEVTQFGRAFPNANFTGVDPSQKPLDAARELVEKNNLQARVALLLGTIDDLEEKQYDAATALLVMHFLKDDGSKLDFLKAIHRRLKPGAQFIIADGCFDKNSKEFDWLLNAFISHARLNGALPEILNNTHKFIEESSPFITETRELELFAEANFGEIRSFFQGLWFRGWVMTRI